MGGVIYGQGAYAWTKFKDYRTEKSLKITELYCLIWKKQLISLNTSDMCDKKDIQNSQLKCIQYHNRMQYHKL